MERHRPAIDGVATDALGGKLAIEHTLLQPYEGYLEELIRLGIVFDRLWRDPIFRLPNHEFVILLPSRCVPAGVDWKNASDLLASWFLKNAPGFPPGTSKHIISDVPFHLELEVENTCPSFWPEGRVFVSLPKPAGPYKTVISRALSEKSAKLANTPADRRVLLFERVDVIRGYVEICESVDEMKGSFSQMNDIDAIWVAEQITENGATTTFFMKIWPGGVGEKFKVTACSTN